MFSIHKATIELQGATINAHDNMAFVYISMFNREKSDISAGTNNGGVTLRFDNNSDNVISSVFMSADQAREVIAALTAVLPAEPVKVRFMEPVTEVPASSMFILGMADSLMAGGKSNV